jgi:homoserine kinase type II
MTDQDITLILARLGLSFARVRPDLPLAGSPDRSLERRAVESADGRPWIVERHHPRDAARKQGIAQAIADLAGRLPEARPWLAFAPGRFVAEHADGAWLVSPYVAGVALDRPAYAFEAWRGEALAGLLVRFRAAAQGMPGPVDSPPLSLPAFVHALFGKLSDRRRPLFERLYPALLSLEKGLFPRLETIPIRFSHGDLHPLNMIWSESGIEALIDFEFCGLRPETYDAALLVGCLGMEDPQALIGGLVKTLIAGLKAGAGYAPAAWELFPDLVLALRFAWLSDWLRRDDREMIDLEAVFIGLLLENRDALARAWA